jgi:predicted nucleic acid-binding protein
MSVVVDTNIIFSAMLNTNSQIAGVLLRPKTTLSFYSTEQLRLNRKGLG